MVIGSAASRRSALGPDEAHVERLADLFAPVVALQHQGAHALPGARGRLGIGGRFWIRVHVLTVFMS
jgi:hypothetical protein